MTREDDHLAMLLIQTNHLKVIADEAQQAYQSAQRELVELLEAAELPSASAFEEDTGLLYTGTLIRSEVAELDEKGLRRTVGADMWDRITIQVVDKKKLEAHVTTGDITPGAVAKNTVVKPRRPYVRFTVKPKRLGHVDDGQVTSRR